MSAHVFVQLCWVNMSPKSQVRSFYSWMPCVVMTPVLKAERVMCSNETHACVTTSHNLLYLSISQSASVSPHITCEEWFRAEDVLVLFRIKADSRDIVRVCCGKSFCHSGCMTHSTARNSEWLKHFNSFLTFFFCCCCRDLCQRYYAAKATAHNSVCSSSAKRDDSSDLGEYLASAFVLTLRDELWHSQKKKNKQCKRRN